MDVLKADEMARRGLLKTGTMTCRFRLVIPRAYVSRLQDLWYTTYRQHALDSTELELDGSSLHEEREPLFG